MLLSGASRGWLAPGMPVEFDGLASFFDPVSMRTKPGENEIVCTVSAKWRKAPASLCVHLRRPDRRLPERVTVNGALLNGSINGDCIYINFPDEFLEIRAEYN